ncbi:hypothetical protein [Moorena producens]|uniref:hypothetical protein n=1 Tax=Moorena producens TaxID=1155739 RepID=UPI0011EA6C69|nr:hypothetical protein [Moorena producens]
MLAIGMLAIGNSVGSGGQCNGLRKCGKCGELGNQLSVTSCLLPLASCLLATPCSEVPTPFNPLQNHYTDA